MQSLFFIHNGYRVIARFWTSIHRKTGVIGQNVLMKTALQLDK